MGTVQAILSAKDNPGQFEGWVSYNGGGGAWMGILIRKFTMISFLEETLKLKG
jgi:hypothetical protein